MSENDKHNHLPFTDVEDKILKALELRREKVNQKFPLWSALTATFGIVAVFYGFEKLIDKVPVLANNPWILLVTGLIILIATGTTYKKL